MNEQLLKIISSKVNKRTLDEDLLERTEEMAENLSRLLNRLQNVSETFPYTLEPTPIFVPNKDLTKE